MFTDYSLIFDIMWKDTVLCTVKWPLILGFYITGTDSKNCTVHICMWKKKREKKRPNNKRRILRSNLWKTSAQKIIANSILAWPKWTAELNVENFFNNIDVLKDVFNICEETISVQEPYLLASLHICTQTLTSFGEKKPLFFYLPPPPSNVSSRHQFRSNLIDLFLSSFWVFYHADTILCHETYILYQCCPYS